MECPFCRKKIDFAVRSSFVFRSEDKRYYHKQCLQRLRELRREREEEVLERAKQRILDRDWGP